MDTARVYNRVNELAQKDQAGYTSAQVFNDRLDAVQLELVEKIYAYLGFTGRAQDILSPFIVTPILNSNSQGIITAPSDYLHSLDLDYQNGVDMNNNPIWIPVRPIDSNQVGLINQSPNRQFNLQKKRIQYYTENDNFQITSYSACTIRFRYIKRPASASIALISNSTPYGVSLTIDPSNTIPLQWNDTAFNLIVLLMLEKLGIEIREQFLMEIASLKLKQEDVLKID
jgi:hypothetical protein